MEDAARMRSCACYVEVLDTSTWVPGVEGYDGDIYRVKGVYSSNGKITCTLKLDKTPIKYLEFSPDHMWPDDPKRLFNAVTEKWTKYRIKSIILDANAIKRAAKPA
jgi:hypothetical protein